MKWFLTTSFEFTEYPKWTFDEFDVALDTAHKLTHSVGNLYLWKETKGRPIKLSLIHISEPTRPY